MLPFILCAQIGAFLPAPERLLISTDDEALGRAIVRSANQHVVGSVELLPPGAAAPPRVLRLLVHSAGSERLTLVLSRGAKLSVARVIRIAGSHGFFDRAEVVALVIDDMRARLNEQLERAHAANAPRPASGQSSAPPALAPPAAEQRASLPAPAPPDAEDAADADILTDAAPNPQQALSALTPVTTAPHLRTAPASLTLAPLPRETVPAGRRWRIGVGVSLEVLGLAVGGLGVASLALDGRCVSDVVPCDYRFDGHTAGTIEAVFGSVAVLTGLGLLASLGYERRAPRRLALALVLSRGALAASGEF